MERKCLPRYFQYSEKQKWRVPTNEMVRQYRPQLDSELLIMIKVFNWTQALSKNASHLVHSAVATALGMGL